MNHSPPCPLCGCPETGSSWYGSVHYLGREFPYLECRRCRSLFAHPMPGDATLAAMYGGGRQYDEDDAREAHSPREELGRISTWLDRLGTGTLVDFGCGAGHLLAYAKGRGWAVWGIEWDAAFADNVAQQTGVQVLPSEEAFRLDGRADVLHLGDVIEHLTDVDRQIPLVLKLLRPGGVLIAEGPLQANFTLFNAVLRATRPVIRRFRETVVAPQHVLLATLAGQKALFRRAGLEELEFSVWETNWPAPDSIGLRDLTHPRTVALYCLGTASRWVSRVNPRRWGNRFFYCGRLPVADADDARGIASPEKT
jgi:SAM-dependent methyltransferase